MKVFGLNYPEKITIGEHTYRMPPPPKSKEDILFYNDKDPCWRRKKDYPDFWYSFSPYKTLVDRDATLYDEYQTELIELSKADTKTIKAIYKQEIANRLNGVFFRNGNDLEYLTGSNWFTLQHCKMFGNTTNDGYGRYFKYQRDVFYLLEIMWHPDILGLYLSKAKKTGITQILDGGYCLDMATRKEEWMIGFMSRNQEVAIENNMKLFLYAFDNLPLALKPKVGFKAAKGGNIEFTERGKLNSPKVNNADVLNTKVFCVPTADHSFDSHFMNIERMDEFPKYWQDSKKEPKEVLRNNKAGCKDQNENRGRIIISSYPPEVDDVGSKQGEEVYLQSKLSTLKYGKTESELICYHIPAHKSLKSCIDKLGDCDEVKAMHIIMQNRDRVKKDKKALLAEIRQNPTDEKEAFETGGITSVFDTIYLNDCRYELEKEIAGAIAPLWVDGNLEWENVLWEVGKKDKRPAGVFCPVRFVPLTESEKLDGSKKATLRIYRDIKAVDHNMPLRMGIDGMGNLLPPEKFTVLMGGDPIAYADTEDVEEGSMQSLWAMNIHNERLNTIHREIVTKIILAEYDGRPELAEAAYQDIVKFIIYFGGLMLLEGNAATFFTRIMNEGLGNYMIVKHKDGYLCRWNITLEKGDYKSVKRTKNQSQDEVMEMIVECLKNYTFRTDEDITQYAKTIKSIGVFEQMIKFDPKRTKKSDKVMGLGYCLICYETYKSELSQVKENYYEEIAIKALFAATER